LVELDMLGWLNMSTIDRAVYHNSSSAGGEEDSEIHFGLH
jgi:hypothetical protein